MSDRLRLVKHPASGVESAQSSAMAGLPCPVQQGTRPATDVEHGLRGHHQSQVETEVVPSLRRAEHVLQLGETALGEQSIDHHTSVPDPRTTSPAHALRPRPRRWLCSAPPNWQTGTRSQLVAPLRLARQRSNLQLVGVKDSPSVGRPNAFVGMIS